MGKYFSVHLIREGSKGRKMSEERGGRRRYRKRRTSESDEEEEGKSGEGEGAESSEGGIKMKDVL